MVGSYTEDLQKTKTNWEMGACLDNTVLVMYYTNWEMGACPDNTVLVMYYTNWEMSACPHYTVLVVMCYGWFSLSGWQAHSSSRRGSLPVWARASDEGSWSAKTLSYISCRPAITHTIAWVIQTAGQLVHLSVNLLAKSVSQSVQLLTFPGFPC